jgi:hypothetical protein
MTQPRRAAFTLVAALAIGLTSAVAIGAQRENDDRKPSLALRATPPLGFSPLRVRVVVDVRGGADDFQDFYCPSIEWDWSDGTVSESSEDCDPYVAGKSAISRRFTAEHTYRQSQPESYRIVFRMKQKDRTVATASTTVQVRAGAGEDFDR